MNYLQFELRSERMPDVKTEVWAVLSAKHGFQLGLIKWYSPWRQYAFFPGPDTIWNRDCLRAVDDKIETLMRVRRNVRANQGEAA
jgi:hypothetical protein